jgi:Bacterial protein of unknown function (DUF882)
VTTSQRADTPNARTAPHAAPVAEHESALVQAEHAVARAAEAILHTAEIAFRLPEPAAGRWSRAGVTPRAERIFDAVAGLVLTLFAVGWTWAIAEARIAAEEGGEASAVTTATATIASALTNPDAPSVAFLTDRVLEALVPLRGASGKLRARIQPAGSAVVGDTLPAGTEIRYSSATGADSASAAAPARSGIWRMAFAFGAAVKPITDLSLITLTPFSEKRGGRIGLYYIGSWPGERGRAGRAGYANPSGFIEVTQDNQGTPVSQHFKLRDFLTHDQQGIWPKYLVLEMRLVDKLELVLNDLETRGYDVRGVRVLSGFRTPQYNATGGDPRGRASLSRHMYGDAADIYIDDNGDGWMDDLNHDGRVNIRDAAIIEAAVDRVEQEHPELVGGCGIYVAAGGHGPFTHIDTRGFRARWIGTGVD